MFSFFEIDSSDLFTDLIRKKNSYWKLSKSKNKVIFIACQFAVALFSKDYFIKKAKIDRQFENEAGWNYAWRSPRSQQVSFQNRFILVIEF